MIKDILVALFSQLDVLSGSVLALNFGFFMLPSALGYLAGAIGSLVTGSITPISFMYESLVLSYGMSKKLRERITMILIAATFTGILGGLGLPQYIVDKVGPEIFLGMLAGVGLYLAKVGLDLGKEDLKVGLPCLVIAILVQIITNDLIWTVSISIPTGIVIKLILGKFSRKPVISSLKVIPRYASRREMFKKELRLVRPVFNSRVVVGAMALSVLTIGGNVAYTAVNLQMAGGAAVPTYNQATIISSVADFASSLFGGANMELIISPTAASTNPLRAAVLYMGLAVILLATGLVHKVAKWVPIAAMGGYLFVIGAILILPYNALDAFKIGNPVVVALTVIVTFLTNPFYGLTSGIAVKYLMSLTGQI